jgi:hypothetical protein
MPVRCHGKLIFFLCRMLCKFLCRMLYKFFFTCKLNIRNWLHHFNQFVNSLGYITIRTIAYFLSVNLDGGYPYWVNPQVEEKEEDWTNYKFNKKKSHIYFSTSFYVFIILLIIIFCEMRYFTFLRNFISTVLEILQYLLPDYFGLFLYSFLIFKVNV